MIKYEFKLKKGKLKKKHLNIWNELLIHAIENKPNKKGEYSIPLAQVLGLGITREELEKILNSFTRFRVEWKSGFPETIKGQARLLNNSRVLQNQVKFSFYNSLLSKIIDDPHFFALLESKLSKISS